VPGVALVGETGTDASTASPAGGEAVDGGAAVSLGLGAGAVTRVTSPVAEGAAAGGPPSRWMGKRTSGVVTIVANAAAMARTPIQGIAIRVERLPTDSPFGTRLPQVES
jgi:hypothetical protein